MGCCGGPAGALSQGGIRMTTVRLSADLVQAVGPLFEVPEKAIAKGARELVEDFAFAGEKLMASHMLQLGVRRTGATAASVRARLVRRNESAAGYAVIMPTRVWGGVLSIRDTGRREQYESRGTLRTRKVIERKVVRSDTSGLPTRTWLAYGLRQGRKLGKQRNFFARTATDLRKRRASVEAIANLIRWWNG